MKGKVACLSDCQWPDALISLFFFLSQSESRQKFFFWKRPAESPYMGVKPLTADIKLSTCKVFKLNMCT